MNYEQQSVAVFHLAMGNDIPPHPVTPDDATRILRYQLIREEYQEVADAILRGGEMAFTQGESDLAEVAKELADLLYVVYGTAVVFGIDMTPVFKAVHESNMSKIADGAEGRRDGKLLKGPNYTPPDIEAIITAQKRER